MKNLITKKRLFLNTFFLLTVTFCGCSQESRLDFMEVKRIDERITKRDYRSFLKIINRLPDRKLLNFPTVFIPPPEWKSNRALPVSGLVQEENEKHAQRWDEESLARLLVDNRPLQKALKYERMTAEQFVGLTLTIGAAMSKSTLRKKQNLDKIITKGKKKIKQLSNQDETFSTIKDKEKQFSILNHAVWITRVNRAERLIEVPSENVVFAKKNWKKLVKIFPVEFSKNPFDSIADLLEELGIPFEESEDANKDTEIGLYRTAENTIDGSNLY